MANSYNLRLIQKDEIAEHLYRLRFEVSSGGDIDFQPGQFGSFLVSRDIRRSFSMANHPSEKGVVELFVDTEPMGPGSIFFLNMQEGDEAEVLAPLGGFVYKHHDSPAHFFAGGVGIAPLMSMIVHELEHNKSGRPIRLNYGVRHEDRFIIDDILNDFEKSHDNFSHRLFVSKPKGDWVGDIGHVTEAVEEIDSPDIHAYICGGNKLISDVQNLLLKQGVDPQNIFYEQFY